eukprot:scaffold160233_cov17-Tisochrysis_lutea.AAC.1
MGTLYPGVAPPASIKGKRTCWLKELHVSFTRETVGRIEEDRGNGHEDVLNWSVLNKVCKIYNGMKPLNLTAQPSI